MALVGVEFETLVFEPDTLTTRPLLRVLKINLQLYRITDGLLAKNKKYAAFNIL